MSRRQDLWAAEGAWWFGAGLRGGVFGAVVWGRVQGVVCREGRVLGPAPDLASLAGCGRGGGRTPGRRGGRGEKRLYCSHSVPIRFLPPEQGSETGQQGIRAWVPNLIGGYRTLAPQHPIARELQGQVAGRGTRLTSGKHQARRTCQGPGPGCGRAEGS